MSKRGSQELRIADVATFLAVVRHGSVTGAARELRVTPSQVSKAVARIERFLRRPLLSRKSRGVVLDEDAADLLPRMRDLLERARVLQLHDSKPERVLTVAAT